LSLPVEQLLINQEEDDAIWLLATPISHTHSAATTLSFHKISDNEWQKKILAGAQGF
jgi:hypothetical protein